MKSDKILSLLSVFGLAISVALPVSALAAQDNIVSDQITYADLVDLADASEIVLRAQIRKQAELKPERAPGLRPGYARLYIEAQTDSLLTGRAAVGESLRYLVDVPRDSKGKAPKLKKQTVLLFARPAAGRPGEIQLITETSQLLWSAPLETRLRSVLAELVAQDAAPEITGIRDVLSIPGNLAGESETQLFLSTDNDGPVSVTVIRRPDQESVWGVSWSDIVDQAARPPQMNTLDWYRLACFLPGRLPSASYLSADPASRRQADMDYRFVLQQLGPCPRNLD
ncbi:hypothetical protein QWY75_12580 [Pontixanthobacter aestiaquae]|uniref:Uncharacterized protein n=1 Tax=Pontixanthobacter aestiaquae TaxID=1509367 RepID=A0A844Z3R4_9SPHN|nr:hypothetical protein [Pontixanthobacter aestiaquae]MDN3647040.1 hypothetical protein [Pontixanthobacter aestiaquae]MXO81982.1 hypothetical protein [Pontixanthobacter aestiaquae]